MTFVMVRPSSDSVGATATMTTARVRKPENSLLMGMRIRSRDYGFVTRTLRCRHRPWQTQDGTLRCGVRVAVLTRSPPLLATYSGLLKQADRAGATHPHDELANTMLPIGDTIGILESKSFVVVVTV